MCSIDAVLDDVLDGRETHQIRKNEKTEFQTIHFNWRQVANGNLITPFRLWKSILRTYLTTVGAY